MPQQPRVQAHASTLPVVARRPPAIPQPWGPLRRIIILFLIRIRSLHTTLSPAFGIWRISTFFLLLFFEEFLPFSSLASAADALSGMFMLFYFYLLFLPFNSPASTADALSRTSACFRLCLVSSRIALVSACVCVCVCVCVCLCVRACMRVCAYNMYIRMYHTHIHTYIRASYTHT